MIKKNICVIPARGGSKRIPNKNIKDFHGMPIVAYSIRNALESGIFNEVYVSSDSDQILEVAEKYGALSIRRDSHLSDDETGTYKVTHDFTTWYLSNFLLQQEQGSVKEEIDIYNSFVCCLYATCPLLDLNTFRTAYQLLTLDHKKMHSISVGYPPLHDVGQYYFSRISGLMLRRGYFDFDTVVVPVPPDTDCDINTFDDWLLCEKMDKRNHEAV